MEHPDYRVGLLPIPNRATVVTCRRRQFMRTNVTRQFRSRERNVHTFVPGNETSTMWSFRSRERKCMGTKRPGTCKCFRLIQQEEPGDIHWSWLNVGATRILESISIFSHRVVSKWNMLDSIDVMVKTVNGFKTKLERERVKKRWVYFWTDVRWTSGLWRDSGAAILQVSCKHRGRTGNETWSHRYICAARWPLENNRIIWWTQVLRT